MHLSTIFPLSAAVYASIALIYKQKIGMYILAPILHRFISFRYKKYSYPKQLRHDMKFLGYKVWPMSALNEMRKLTNQIKKILPEITCPVLFIHAQGDKLSPISNIHLVYDSIASLIKKKLIVKNANHNLFLPSPDQKFIFDNIIPFINKNKPREVQ